MIYSKIELLQSDELKKDLVLYLDFLLQKQFVDNQPFKRIPKFGSAKGTFILSPDFNNPIDDFKDYMPV